MAVPKNRSVKNTPLCTPPPGDDGSGWSEMRELDLFGGLGWWEMMRRSIGQPGRRVPCEEKGKEVFFEGVILGCGGGWWGGVVFEVCVRTSMR